MEKEILREIMEECNDWKERLVVKMFPKLFIKIYGEIGKSIFNDINKNL